MVDKHMLGDDTGSCKNSPQWDDDTKTRIITRYLINQGFNVFAEFSYLVVERNYEEICFKGVHEFIKEIRDVWGNIPEKEGKETHPKIVKVMDSLRILLAIASKVGVANNSLWGGAMRFAVQLGVDHLVREDLKILDSGDEHASEANDEDEADEDYGETSPIAGESSDNFDPLEEFYTNRKTSTIDLVD